METFNPKELARYTIQEQERICIKEASGENTTGEDEALEGIYNKYVLPRSIYGYAASWKVMSKDERDHWGRWWLQINILGPNRELCLISLFIVEKERSWKFGKNGEKEKERIKDLIARYYEVNKELMLPIIIKKNLAIV